MKLSTSSSIFFATLALSSSSSTLAAPARDTAESGLSVSPSTHELFDSAHPAPHCSAHRTQPQPTPVSADPITARSIPALQSSLSELVGQIPILGPILEPILAVILSKSTPPVQKLVDTSDVSVQEDQISPQDMTALQAAIQEVTRALNNTVVSKLPMPSPVSGVANGLPIPVAQSDFDPAGPAAASGSTSAMSSAQASSSPSMAVNDVPSSSSKLPSVQASSTPSMVVNDVPVPSSSSKFPASATPPSVAPVNLPNSSSLPVRLPV